MSSTEDVFEGEHPTGIPQWARRMLSVMCATEEEIAELKARVELLEKRPPPHKHAPTIIPRRT